ncbi:YwqI/YxiC family protein [Oceanobacillus halophilus]|uniref:YwqI/YxiC family protein n=1 Tax=Oceanobacillus halophilus TaxID=930130 RepID=A0A495A538_9BACI|nr:YwqI/YxiC family protein [Oceanobacillus halophilus]RKQ34722.1 hypothetical protein D8M06_07340 [Oceanobacillus halophilus]
MSEIKVVQSAVEKALSELRASTTALETSFAKEIQGQNQLDMVDKLNEIRQNYETILATYQALLLQNIESTSKSVETLKQTDERITSSIRQLR